LISPDRGDLTPDAAHFFLSLSFGEADVARIHELAVLADASVVATAECLGIQRVLTVDERHFRAIRPRKFSHLVLLPADASGN